MSASQLVRIPTALYTEVKSRAADMCVPASALISLAVRAYLDTQKPKKPASDVSPQARGAMAKADHAAATKTAAALARAAALPEVYDGCEVYRYGISDWTPANPGYEYRTMGDTLPDGTAITVRVLDDDYERRNTVVLPTHIPERAAHDLPDDWGVGWGDE